MRILFAYFDFCNQRESYRGFKQCGLNFSTNRVFSVEKDEDNYSLRYKNKPEEQIIKKGFWGDKRIYNLTALVGDNGAGKSTLLHELIRACTVQGRDPGSSFILVIERTYAPKKEKLVVYTNIEGLHIDFSENVEVTYSYPECMKKTKIFLLDNTLSLSDIELSKEYYAPEQRYISSKTVYDQFYNVTTVSAIDYSIKISGCESETLSPTEYLATHLRYETFQQLRFIFDGQNRQKLFDLRDKGYSIPIPDQLTISIEKNYYRNTENGRDDLVDEFLRANWGCSDPENRSLLVYLLSINNIINVYNEKAAYADPGYNVKDFYYNIFYEQLIELDNEKDRSMFDEVIKVLAEERNIPLCEYQKYIDFNHYIWDNQILFEKFFFCVKSKAPFLYVVKIADNINNASSELDTFMIEFIDRYRHTIQNRYYLTFSWGLSSGENNLLRLFTKIRYSVNGPISGISYGETEPEIGLVNKFELRESQQNWSSEKKKDKKYFCDTLLFMLDEADLTFHPEWQRQLISILTAYIPKIIMNPYDPMHKNRGCKDIQIIITTHSPLMLGDFPEGNVLYLHKDEGITEIDEFRKVNSFGQNLYTILKDSFYLKRTIGEFAYRQINAVVDYTNKVKEASRKKRKMTKYASEFETYWQIVCLLPSGIIKSKLTDELDSCRLLFYPDNKITLLREKREFLKCKLSEVEHQLAEMDCEDE